MSLNSDNPILFTTLNQDFFLRPEHETFSCGYVQHWLREPNFSAFDIFLNSRHSGGDWLFSTRYDQHRLFESTFFRFFSLSSRASPYRFCRSGSSLDTGLDYLRQISGYSGPSSMKKIFFWNQGTNTYLRKKIQKYTP